MTYFLHTLGFAGALYIGLCALAWIDIKTYRLPNVLTYPLVVIGLIASFKLPHITPKSALIGAVTGYLAFVIIERIFKQLYKKDGLGRGDAKLLAVGGAWCGWFGLPYIILIASLCGLIFASLPSQKQSIKKGNGHIPFGPFLALGIALIWAAQLYYWQR